MMLFKKKNMDLPSSEEQNSRKKNKIVLFDLSISFPKKDSKTGCCNIK